MRKRDHSLLANGASLLVCGLLAGLVVAAAAFPAVAMGGLAAKAGADTFDSLPTDLDVLPAPQISEVYASDGKTLLTYLYDENRHDVPISEVAPIMRDALVASEDIRFYDHNGVDFKGVARAFVANQQSDGVAQGASTLTMQYVRQVIGYTAKTPQQVLAATEKTPARKLAEIKRALALEKKLNKEQILERYLNIASFGHNAYGIYAASQVYFGKPPSELKLEEAALLAGLVQAPSAYDPADEKKRPKALERRVYVLNQLVKLGKITQQQADEAQKIELNIKGERTPEGCGEVQRTDLGAGFFCDYMIRWWNEQEAFGADRYERENRLRSRGYKIVTTLDIQTQAGAKRNIEQYMGKRDPSEALMLAATEPGTGKVRMLAANRNYSNDQSGNGINTEPTKKARGVKGNYPNTTVPLLSGGADIQGYQVGSVFKIFTLVTALKQGIQLDYEADTPSPVTTKYILERGSPAACPGTVYYCPKNSGGNGQGIKNMWTAFGSSTNTFFVPLQEKVGADKVVETAKSMGIRFHSDEDRGFGDNPKSAVQWGAFTLGVSIQTPLEMANAYATLAADGKYCTPTPIEEITEISGGAKVEGGAAKCEQVMSEDVARAATDAARCPVGDKSQWDRCAGGTATGMKGQFLSSWPIAGKTGTTDSEKSATFEVFTKQLSVFGVITDPDYPRTPKVFKHDQVNPAVAATLRDGMQGKPAIQFGKPSSGLSFGAPKAPRPAPSAGGTPGGRPPGGGCRPGQPNCRPGG
ncbi:penicillin-binding protein [Virgisporangium aliadipatigenens]|uniref:Penicillin-binding protein n=1 Tax=Virgisporangium aliadipatigenens TaxID=741659 RepID=A0A8J3YJL1_9ACTN|nr:transglycosylase domain-containing protein [Virgisporangium aliadipatigenens]GIJ45126.1 penicillin-binding protein [Virgisporangium aliadipatigenens]